MNRVLKHLITYSCVIVWLLLLFPSSAQGPTEQLERLIIQQERDSIALLDLDYLDTLGEKMHLKRIANGTASYSDHLRLIKDIDKRPNTDYSALVQFIDQIKAPDKDEPFNSEYFQIRLAKLYFLRNDLLDIQSSKIAFETLSNYLSNFPDNLESLTKARIQLALQPIYIKMIEEDLSGKGMIESLLSEPIMNTDTALAIEAIVLLNEFVILERDMQGFIENAERAYSLESQLAEHSDSFGDLMTQLINVLSFAGNQESRVFDLLKELYLNQPNRYSSYSLFMQFLGDIGPDSPYAARVFDFFNVQNALELAEFMRQDAAGKQDRNNEFHLLRETGNMLHTFKEYDNSMTYMNESIIVSRAIYSKDLSKALASYKTSLIQKEKEAEVALANTKTEFFKRTTWIVGSLMLVILVLLFVTYRNTVLLKKQRNELTEQRDLINTQKQEKELLLKEIHHRVKNNFQIMLSLMDAQAAEVKDEKFQILARQGIQRIKVMSMVHDYLFDQDNLNINLKRYLNQLVTQLTFTFGSELNPQLDIQIPDMALKMNEGILLGLVTNELITNSFKYGFDQESPVLKVVISPLSETNRYELYVQDNGKDKSGIDLENTGVGLGLVKRLTRQLGGNVHFDDQEAAFRLTFQVS